MLSPAFLADRWTEFGEQLVSFTSVEEGRGRVVAVTLHPCEPPPRLRFRVGLDCTDWTQWDEQAGRLRDLLGRPEPTPEVIPCPYPGMVPFPPRIAVFLRPGGGDPGPAHQAPRTPVSAGDRLIGIREVVPGSGRAAAEIGRPERLLARHLENGHASPGATPLKELAARLGGDPDPPEAVVTALLAASPPRSGCSCTWTSSRRFIAW